MGLYDLKHNKKELFYAFKTLVTKLEHFTSVESLSQGCTAPSTGLVVKGPSGSCRYKFTFQQKGPVYVVWGEGSLPLEIGSGTWTVTDYQGNKKVLDAAAIAMDDSPIFLQQ